MFIAATPTGSRDSLEAIPSLPDGGFPGDRLDILNRGSVELTLISESTLPGSRLHLKSERLTLEPTDAVQLIWDGYAWYEMSRSTPASLQSELFAEDFGLLTSNSGADNAIALAAAVASAISTGKVLVIPPGTFEVSVHGAALFGVASMTATCRIRGSGKSLTKLKAVNFNETADASAMLFRKPAGAFAVWLESMWLEGPDAADLTIDTNNIWSLWGGGGGEIHLHDIKTTLWCQAIKLSNEYPSFPGASDKIFLTGACEIGFRCTGLLHNEGNDPTSALFYSRGTTWSKDLGVPQLTTGPASNGSYDCTYINRGVTIDIDGDRFLNADTGFGLLHYGGSAAPLAAPRVVNAYFGPGLLYGMLTGSTTRTLLANSAFHVGVVGGVGGTGIALQGPLHLANVHFYADTDATVAIVDNQLVSQDVLGENCSFYGPTGGGGFNVASVRRIEDSTHPWVFINPRFGNVKAGASCVEVNAGIVKLVGPVFEPTTGVYTVRMQGGRTILEGARHRTGVGMYIDTFSGAVVLELTGDQNVWEATAKTEINALTASVQILGNGPRSYEATPGLGEGFGILSSTGMSNLTGNLRCAGGIGTYSYAAGVLTLSWSADTYSVDQGGAPTIDNIYLNGSVTGGAAASDHLRMCSARIVLKAKQTFTLGAGGNIVPTGGAHAVAANSSVTLQYFPADAKWYEVSA